MRIMLSLYARMKGALTSKLMHPMPIPSCHHPINRPTLTSTSHAPTGSSFATALMCHLIMWLLPVQHALQGHPESGAFWERFINNKVLRCRVKSQPRASAACTTAFTMNGKCSSPNKSMTWPLDAATLR
jgi:hypothetical protein